MKLDEFKGSVSHQGTAIRLVDSASGTVVGHEGRLDAGALPGR